MEMPSNSAVKELIGSEKLSIWESLTASIDGLYDMERTWNKGFGDWVFEYKYRRGGKTLCAFYAKRDIANILIIFGKAEREKFDLQRENFSEQILSIYDETKTYHDGKWLWIPIDEKLSIVDVLNMLKLKRKPNRK